MLLNLTIAIAIAVVLSVVGEHVNVIFVNSVLCLLLGLFVRPVEKRGRGVSYPWPCNVCGAPPLLRNIKYTGMCYFKKKNFLFSERGPTRMFP